MTADKIIQILDELMLRLQGPAEHIFEVFVKQTYVEAFKSIYTAILCVIAFTIAFRWLNKNIKKLTELGNDGVVLISLVAIPAVVLGIPVATICVIRAITYLMNPEYYAITKILEVISGN